METRSLKALSLLHLQGNLRGNCKETASFPGTKNKETCHGVRETERETGGAQGARADSVILAAIAEAGASGKRWRQTPEVDAVEARLHASYCRLLAGLGDIDEYKSLVREWIATGSALDGKETATSAICAGKSQGNC